MKRILTISAVLLAAGFTVAVRQAGAQPSSNKAQLDEAAKQYRAAEEHARKAAEASGEARSDDQQALRDKLRPLVEESFVARQKFQSAEVEMLGRRLAEITQTINDREKNKEAIIDARIDELLNPGRVSDTEKNEPVSQIDLLDAKEYAAAQQEISLVRRLHENGAVSDQVLRDAEKRFSRFRVRPGLPSAEASAAPYAARPPVLGYESRTAGGKFVPFVQPQAGLRVPLNPPSDPQSLDVPADEESAAQSPPQAGYTIREERFVENGKPITRLVRIPINGRMIPQKTLKGEVSQLASDGSDLDLDTRERLARLDLEEAIAKRDLSAKDFESHRRSNENNRGSTPKGEMRKLEAALQLAEIGAKRANVNLEGLAKQRAELESRADAAIAEATAAQQKAAAGVRISEANREAAQAQLQKAEADLEAAESHQKYRDKQHQRIKKLVEDHAVDEKLADESEEHLATAKAALTGARSAVATAKANVDQTASAIDEAKAALKVADLRLLAAQAHRDRLKQRAELKNGDPIIPTTKPAADAP
jgi:hypothetical protein